MKNVRKHIENLVSDVLKETIENKADQILESAKDMTEKLHGGQKKLDVAEPKGKITGADFKKLRGEGATYRKVP